jgi:iron complex outermembrane receptor protein
LNENKNLNNLLELTLNYVKKSGNVDINVVGGYSIQSFRNQWMWSGARGFTDYNFDSMEDAVRNSTDAVEGVVDGIVGGYNTWGVSNDLRGGAQTTGGFVGSIESGEAALAYFGRPAGVSVDALAANYYDQTDYLQSYFGRGNFTINGKYLITATVRADGSSRFGDDNKYGVFPSAAVAWQLHEEDFIPESFNTLKLRVGYGVVGNQDGLGYGEFIRRERYADSGVGDSREINVPGTTTQGGIRPSLKWESTKQTSIGFDFGFIGEKLTGAFDYYNKQTTDLLLRYAPAQPALSDIIFQNLDAIVENKGWEFSLNYQIVENNDAAFSVGGNISHNKNTVKDFAGELNAGQIYGQGLSGAFAQRLAGGRPLFSYYLREFEGFDETGQPIGDNQTYVGKTALPTWNMGFNINGRYKKFDLTLFFAGQFGHYIYNNTQNGFFTAGSINNGRNVTPDVLTSGEAGSAEAAVSTRFLEKGDFVRMQNLSLGYNAISSGQAIKKLRISLTAQNLFLITNYSGLDPEVSSSPAGFSLMNSLPTAGIDYGAYPKPRTFTIGLNATF